MYTKYCMKGLVQLNIVWNNLYVYARASSEYRSLLHRGKLLTNKLLTQGYCKPRLIKTIKKFLWPSSWDCRQVWCFCVQNDLGHFWDPIVLSLGFLHLFCNIHVTGVSTEPGGAYSSGAPGLASISEVHVLTQFCQINVLRIYDYGIPLIGILVL